MIDYQTFHQLRQLHDQEHLSVAQIAAALHLDERTVGKWVQRPTYQPRQRAACQSMAEKSLVCKSPCRGEVGGGRSLPVAGLAYMKPLLLFFTVVVGWSLNLSAPASAQPLSSNHLAQVDAQGVLRWQDTGQQIALFGVNYYTPFWHNYPDLKAIGADHRKVIEQDVAHFARLGLDALRLHVFDREISDRDGNLIENEHLQLLDYLIACAKDRGICTVLTPIAWWPVPGDSPGFSTRFTMPQMITGPAARAPQTNYLAQFLRHVNRHTGLAYKDDPAVVCLELINEPQYAPNTTDAQIIGYINALADAVRATGCRKPVFYNGWGNRLAAVRDARVEGSTFGWYPTGLVAGHSLRRNFLPLVDQYGGSDFWNPSMRTEVLARKAKIIYEFDAADVPGSFMYPAMARSFRSGGAQIATQFQYDPLPLAPFNQGWQTHFLNLVCAPQKAVSFLIAAEAFRRLPRLENYGRYPASTRFGPFRVSYEEDLSEMATEREFLHSNNTRTEPPAPDKLERIVGCGTSPIVRYEGTGAYFLEKLGTRAWRLEVYPDALWVNDPYGPHSLSREVSRIFWREWPMEIRLHDLGGEFGVTPLDADNAFAAHAKEGRFTIRPGVYLLKGAGVTTEDWKTARLTAHVGLREFVTLPGKNSPVVVRHEALGGWIEGKPLSLQFTVATPKEPLEVTLEFQDAGAAIMDRLPLRRQRAYQFGVTVPGEWLKPGQASYSLAVRSTTGLIHFPANVPGGISNAAWSLAVSAQTAPVRLFDAERHKVNPQADFAWKKSLVSGMTPGHRALRIAVERFGPPPNSISFRNELNDELDPWRDLLAQRTTLHVRAQALETNTTALEMVLLERDGSVWGRNVPLTTEWRDLRVPLASLRHFAHWAGNPPERGGVEDHLRPSEVFSLSVCFGAWLYPGHAAEPHTIEIESVEVE